MQQDLDIALIPVEAVLLVADVTDRHARDVRDPVLGHRLGSTRLAGDDDFVGRRQRLASGADGPWIDAGLGALAEEQIDNLIGDAIAHLVRVTLGNGFAREQVGFTCHLGPRALSASLETPVLSQALPTGSRTTGRNPATLDRRQVRRVGTQARNVTIGVSVGGGSRFAGEGAHEIDDGTAHPRIGNAGEGLVKL
jgi:hypothetical protein